METIAEKILAMPDLGKVATDAIYHAVVGGVRGNQVRTTFKDGSILTFRVLEAYVGCAECYGGRTSHEFGCPEAHRDVVRRLVRTEQLSIDDLDALVAELRAKEVP